MKLSRRNFIKGAISAIVAAVCKAVPSLRSQADVGKSSQTADNLGMEGDAIVDVRKYIADYLATKNKPETLRVKIGRPLPLMPRWGISAEAVRARIDTLKEQPQGGYVVPKWLHDDFGFLWTLQSDGRYVITNAQPMEVQIGWYDVTGT